MRARKNRSSRSFDIDIDPDVPLSEEQIRTGLDEYRKWHWGIPAEKVRHWADPDFPDMLVECGRLARLHFRLPRHPTRHPLTERDTMIEFSRSAAESSFGAYDPNHPNQRLYLLLAPRTAAAIKPKFWDGNDITPIPLKQAATLCGGRQAQGAYPNVMVKPFGVLSAIVYVTEKKADPAGPYLHKMGEVTHHYPFLCADAKGRLWLAGGGYRAGYQGIED